MSLISTEESFHCFGPSPDFDDPSGDIFRRHASKIRIPVNKPKSFFAQPRFYHGYLVISLDNCPVGWNLLR